MFLHIQQQILAALHHSCVQHAYSLYHCCRPCGLFAETRLHSRYTLVGAQSYEVQVSRLLMHALDAAAQRS